MDYDKFSTGKSVLALTVTTISTATTTSGAIIDTKGYGSLVVGLYSTITNGYISAVTFQEGDNSSLTDAATLDDSELLINDDSLPLTATGIIRVGCITKKRYVRVRVTTATEDTVSMIVHAIAELNDAQQNPQQVASSVLDTDEINAPSTEADTVVTAPKREE
jgi:hypothetical protein